MSDNGWIKFSERMPECYVEVLVYVNGHRGPSWGNNHCLVAYLGITSWWEERHDLHPLIGVTHWRPLPEPPSD